MSVKQILFFISSILLTSLLVISAAAQSTISGDVTGVVTDPTGAVLPNAPVTLKNNNTGTTQTANTNGAGVYRFSLLSPGNYTVSVSPQGFQTVQRTVDVTVGQASTLNLQAAISGGGQTVEVTAEGAVVQTNNGNISTTFTPEQISLVPNPGNDLTYIIQTAPGAVMNSQAGYGNSSVYGLPASSNLFTLDGMNENDPFFNISNSGATNLLLGQNDVQEVTVVSNGYSGQYGQLGGANVNYVTKSGTNKYHGNAIYYWNGSLMNANDWFRNNTTPASPRPFDNANQWAASFGGPIRKNKTFFFADTEGIRVIIPSVNPVYIPSPQFQAATLANLATQPNGAAQIPFYTNMFNLYNSAPGASAATNSLPGGGCGGVTIAALGAAPCALQFSAVSPGNTREWLLTARVDQNIGNNDRMFIHFKTDHGFQSSYSDPINSAFNLQSTQPQYEGQLNETHTFGSQAVNQFVVSGSWYSAIFAEPNVAAALALQPYELQFAGGTFYPLGYEYNVSPDGRNDTQYQITDDFSKIIGKHNLKFGMVFRRNDITDYDMGLGSIGSISSQTLTDFYNGVGDTYTQSFPVRPSQPIALYGLDFYAQDEFAVKQNLKLTLALRAEHNSNPTCVTNCFARFGDSFENIGHDVNQPYNQAIQTGLNQALINFTNIEWEPRFGFAWTPFGAGRNTVIRGGVGIFADIFPGTVADDFIRNAPYDNTFNIPTGALSPAAPGNLPSLAAASNAAFSAGFASGGTLSSISSGVTGFSPPSLFNVDNTIHTPQYQEWNLEVQQGIGQKASFSLNYVGNHGIHEPIQNAGLNAYCNVTPLTYTAAYAATPTCASALGTTTGFAGLPLAPTDPRFGTITEVSSNGISNYNGLTATFSKRFSQFQMQFNYTWSHALDEISNGGFLPFSYATNESILSPENPYNLRQYNYGNADYDTRQYVSANYVWNMPTYHGWLGALASWTVSGTIFFRTGLPFTAYDTATYGALSGYGFGTAGGIPIFADTSVAGEVSCDRSAAVTPCVSSTVNTPGGEYSPATTGFGPQRRNQLYGPNFFDTDLTAMKTFKIPHWEGASFGMGLQFFNLFNHANFDQPVGDVNSPQFGTSTRTVSVPTSILGSFLGGDASPRIIQIKGQITF